MNAVLNAGLHCTGLLLVLGLVVFAGNAAADCAADRIEIHRQDQVDAFQTSHGPCDRLEGDLIIVGSEIENLHGLAGLEEIGGELFIENSRGVKNLAGLDSLRRVEGDVTIFHNFALESLDGMDRLRSVGGNFAVFANPLQRNIDALAALQTVGGFLAVSDLHSLQNVEGLISVRYVGSHLIVVFNHELQRLDGLDSLRHVGGYVRVNLNPHLHSCVGLGRLLDDVDDSVTGPGTVDVPDVGGIIQFEGNMPGCLSVAQIRTAYHFEIDPAINGLWITDRPPEQGVLVSVSEVDRQALVGWFDLDTSRPAFETHGLIAAISRPWRMGVGRYSRNRIYLNIDRIREKRTDVGSATLGLEFIGTAILEVSSCEIASLSYDFPSLKQHGVLALSRNFDPLTPHCSTR